MFEMVPQVVPAQANPLNVHVTAVLLAPVTVALNCRWPFTPTELDSGETVTPTLDEATVAVVEPETPGLVMDIAVTFTVSGLGAVAGAV